MRFWVAVVLAWMTTGCASDDVDEHGSEYVEIDDLGAANRLAYCTYLTRCGIFLEPTVCLGAELLARFEPDPNLIVAVKAGRVLYRGDKARACADASANATCDGFDDETASYAACSEITTGTIAGGESCGIHEECKSQHCEGGGNGTTCALGTCVGDVPAPSPRAPIGAACALTSDCAEHAYCDTVCAKRKAENEPCAGADECEYGLVCQGAPAVCTALPHEGQACNGQCRELGVTCSIRGICEKVRLPPSACTDRSDCSGYYPCNLELGVCAPGPMLGEPCDWFENPCVRDDTFCDRVTLTCVHVRAVGEPCRSNFECVYECDVDASTPVCAPPPPVCF